MTFGRPDYDARRADRIRERQANMDALARSRGRPAVMGGSVRAAPKTQAYRDPALLEMARDRPCLLLVPMMCNHRTDTTVACHSNLGIHGKGGRRRAEDVFSVWGCASCHRWLDQPLGHSGPSREQKAAAFMEAHLRQVLAWRQVAADPGEPERFRKAAQRALERLNATPLGEL